MTLEYIGLFIFILIGLVLYRNFANGKDAPFVPMEADVVERVMQLAEVKEGDVFYDLGSGDGRLVIAAALHGAKATGIEIDKFRVWYSKLWMKIIRIKNAKILNEDVFSMDLSDATVISTYLLPETHERLKTKLTKELKKGTKVVAIGFEFVGWKPVKIDPHGTIYGPIFLYEM